MSSRRFSMSLKRTPSTLSASDLVIDTIAEEEVPVEDDKVCEMYEAILDHMLTTPQMKEKLMASQNMDKKRQFVKMHKQLFSTGWGDPEIMLLNGIQKAKIPDINSLTTLKISLKAANKEFMNSFLEAGGVSILLKATENRLNKNPVTELDIAILYEIISCLKAVMNNATGMDGLLSVNGAIDTIARSLNFDYKAYALLVLEILSVCCYYSDRSAQQVVDGMKHLARSQKEAAFASLTLALLQQDIEVKASVVQFVNSMVMGVADSNSRTLLRNDLNCQLFGERYDEAVRLVESELQIMKDTGDDASLKSPQGKLRRRSMISLHGIRAYNDKKVDAIIKNTNLSAISEDGSILGTNVEVKSKNQSIFVNPLQGTMAGMLMSAKNTEKLESKFLDVFGGKKTKRRWYELDSESFKWCAGHEKDAEYKGSVAVSTITDIRPYSSDHSVVENCPHAFEIETSERVFAFGCETSADKDSWVTALETCRDNYVMTKGTYKLQFRELTTADVYQFTDMLKKQGAVFHSIAAEDKREALSTVGLDLSDCVRVGRYLQCETVAAGTNSKLLSIMHELLIIPSGADGTWDAIRAGIKRLREISGRDGKAGNGAFGEQTSTVELLNAKAAAGGGAYSQVSKLALSTLASEQEVQRLSARLKELDERVELLAREKADIESNITQLARQQAVAMAPVASLAPTPPPREPKPTPNSSSSATSTIVVALAPSVAVDPRFAKYDKMRKMLPAAVVRQKMSSDGFSEGEIEGFFNGNASVTQAPAPVSAAQAPESVAVEIAVPAFAPPAVPIAVTDERYTKYDKMRKMLPEGAVRQKMASDGFSPLEVDQYFSGELPASVTAPPMTAPPVATAAPVADERYAKYDKMRKMLPEGAVRQKMTGDGFSPEDIDRYFSGEVMTAAAPVVVTASASITDPRFEKYDKMRKMLPEGAVRQKMTGDGFSADEIDRYFNGEVMTVAAPASAAAAPVADPRFEKYDKMRKMLPEGAVRQKMTGDGFSAVEIDRFFSGEIMLVAAVCTAAAPVADPRFEKYDKMRKMLPEGAVRQKMTGDGFTASEIDRFFSGEVMTVAAVSAAAPAALDPRFEKYDKMRKMLPEGAVRQKMVGDGFTSAEIDGFFNPGGAPVAAAAPKVAAKPVVAAPVVELPPDGMSAKPKIVPAVKLKGVFWSKLKAAEVQGTVWHKLKDHKLSSSDVTRLEEWFSAKVAEPSAADKFAAAAKAALAAAQPKAIAVLDGKRTQNVSLIIGKIRRDPEGITKLIVEMDPNELTAELTSMLFSILPTPEELTAIKDFANPSQLDAASKVLFQFNRIPRLQQRMECHEIAFTWFTNANAVSNQFSVIQTACSELGRSQQPMETLLSMILAIGNHINGDTARGQAYGVRLDIFMKLANLKAALPSQGSLMHYLALIAESHSLELVTLSQQWMGISAAAEVSLKQITIDFNQLDAQVNKMNTEFTRIKDSKDNVGLDGKLEDSNGYCTNPLHKRLDKFLREAKPRVLAIKDLSKSVEAAVEGVMNKYGESLKGLSEEDPCKKFFGMLNTFGRQLGAAYDDNRTARELAEKAARALAEAEAKRQAQTQGGLLDKEDKTKAVLSPAAAKKKPAGDNIFGNFHNSQKASADDVMEEFKRKMQARQQKG